MAAPVRSSLPLSTPPPVHKPNPHPYAIKTTSTALLSGSNSSSHISNHVNYHYLPPSPSPSPTRARTTAQQGHHYSKSLSDELPSPLPTPPHSSSSQGAALPESIAFKLGPNRLERADTVPVYVAKRLPPAPASEDLPSNPKLWTTSELALYLTTSLRAHSGESFPTDLAAFLRGSGLTSRVFLRATDADLEEMGVEQKWRAAFLAASRNLRQNILRGRIWTLKSPSEELPSPSPSDDVFPSALYSSSSSSSSVDLALTPDPKTKPHRSGYHNGRVRRMVASLERSASFSEGDQVESSGQRWRDVNTEKLMNRFGRSPSVSQSEDGHTTHAAGTVAPPSYEMFAGTIDAQRAEEPTVEALLSSSHEEILGSWGARAWEEFDSMANAVTVKKLPISEENSAQIGTREVNVSELNPRGATSQLGKVSVSDHTESKGRKKVDRILAAAIFAGSDAANHEKEDPELNPTRSGECTIIPAVVDVSSTSSQEHTDLCRSMCSAAPVKAPEAQVVEGLAEESCGLTSPDGPVLPGEHAQSLEAELQDTRELLAAFKKRLEEVERRVDEMANEGECHGDAGEDDWERNRVCPAPGTMPLSPTVKDPEPSDDMNTAHASVVEPDVSRFMSEGGGMPEDATTIAGPRLHGIPTYVLLVGIGISSAVLSVFLRKVARRIKT